MRTANDFYETPAWQTRALLKRFKLTGVLFECCSGDLSIYRMLDGEKYSNDIDDSKEADLHRDAARFDSWADFGRVGWTITNPPFNCAFPILKNAFAHSRLGVILLLRLSFMEPTKERGDWLAEHPPQFQFILPRWSYKGNGSTDSVTTAWYIWRKHNVFDSSDGPAIQIVPRSEMEGK